MAEQRGARLSVETKRRILAIRKEERSLGKIRSVLCLRYGVKVSRQGIYMFLKKWDRDQTLVRKTRVPASPVHDKNVVRRWPQHSVCSFSKFSNQEYYIYNIYSIIIQLQLKKYKCIWGFTGFVLKKNDIRDPSLQVYGILCGVIPCAPIYNDVVKSVLKRFRVFLNYI